MGSCSNSSAYSAASFESPTLTSLPKPLLLQIVRLLDAPSMQHLRLTNEFLKCTADELVTSIKYGTASDSCNSVKLESVAERWHKFSVFRVINLPSHFFSLLFFLSVAPSLSFICNGFTCAWPWTYCLSSRKRPIPPLVHHLPFSHLIGVPLLCFIQPRFSSW